MEKNRFRNKMEKKNIGTAQNSLNCKTVSLSIDLIDENPRNQEIFNMNDIDKLAEYIQEVGFNQPILVYQKKDGRYEIIAGHRKYRAKKSLGDKNIECVIKSAPSSEGDRVYQLIFDNFNSRKLTIMDTARSMREIRDVWLPEQRSKGTIKGDTNDILAKKFNVSPSKVARTLRLLNLSPSLQAKVDNGIMAVDVALVLLQDENIKLDNLQDFINNLIDEQIKDNKSEDFKISKSDLIKMITNYKATNESSKAVSKDTKKSNPITRKKFIKAAGNFSSMLEIETEPDFKLEEEDVNLLSQLRDKIDTLLNQRD